MRASSSVVNIDTSGSSRGRSAGFRDLTRHTAGHMKRQANDRESPGCRANHIHDFSLNNGNFDMDRTLRPVERSIGNRYIIRWKSFVLMHVSCINRALVFAGVVSALAVYARAHQLSAKGDHSGSGTVCNSGEPRAERSVVDCSRRTRSSSQNPASGPPFDCDRSGSRFSNMQWESVRRSGGKGARSSDRGSVRLFLGN